MAPNKRRRTIEDDDEEDDLTQDPPTRQLQQRPVKRTKSRVARAHENGGSAVSDEDSHEEETNGTDGGESETEDNIVERLQNDKDFVKGLREERENQPAEYGIIEEVLCQNFMCHERLKVKLGPLINFIIGHNGSGKSAVLTALTLCLGAKATVTNRGASLKNFIKEGQDHAMVSVKIKNQGEMGYQNDLYGDSIIVERHFARGGTSGFKLKSAEGRIITTKRSDLEDMLDFLGLQLDNPMNVLSQDLARQFLSNSTPHDKYKFFLRGTQLEQLDRDYRIMNEYIDQSEEKLEARDGDVKILKSRLDKAERKMKEMELATTINERIKNLEWMHAWAQVEEQERERDQAGDNAARAEQTLIQRQRKAQEQSDVYTAKNEHLEAARGVQTDLEVELRPLEDQHNEILTEFNKNKDLLVQNQAQRRHIHQDWEHAKRSVVSAQQKIETEEQRIEESSGPAQAEKLAELRDAERESELRKNEYDSGNDKRPLERERDEAQSQLGVKQAAVQPLTRAVKDAETRLQDLRNEGSNRMRGFNNNMQSLLKAINNERGFSEKPIGPIGLHVKLLKPEWSSVVESTFGQVLEAFIVSNTRDQVLLRRLQERHKCTGDIYIGRSEHLDISGKKAQTEYDTLLDILEIDHEAIRNQVIINQAAEQTVLVRDRQKGSELNSARRPRVKAVLTMHDTIRNEGHRFALTANGPRVDRVKPWTRAARMQTNIDAQIATQREIIADAKRRENEHLQEIRTIEERVRSANQALQRFKSQQRDRRVAMQEADERVQTLKDELESAKVDAGTLDALRGSLEEAQRAAEMHLNSYDDAKSEKKRIDEMQAKVKASLDEARAKVEEKKKKIEKTKASITKSETARTLALREKNLAIAQAEEAEKAKEAAEQEHREWEEKVTEFVKLATEITPRIPVDEGMTTERIEHRIHELKSQRRDLERRQAWQAAKRYYNEAEGSVKGLRNLIDCLKKSYFSRKETWKAFRKWITARARIMFVFMLHERDFKGRLEAHHEDRTLDIFVEPDATQRSNEGRKTKTLSGGEKSFSTICLLLAIWEAMGSPIRCLDEFDVFMDNVNRDTSMRMMIQAARRAVGKQYILITPQSMGQVPIEADVKIHRMSDPERGQTALPYNS
ncbi:hypothetical protein CAC42_1167 [Sphaceloma murrayae]|uniref:RecF/RecN/SMC N-terminal domain-containing protein n=1 Tax=Sphaceloma murrayae TaxID=2082308 RepID=A0A2K1R256_9PEZI|nr:hypothetical protein CAC42_1167 [Sphaceloma murrayae]